VTSVIQRRLAGAITDAIARAQANGVMPGFEIPPFELERPQRKEHGDWSTGIAMMCARQAGMAPRDIAEAIIDALGTVEHVASIDIAGPGFINFTLSHAWLTDVVREVAAAGTSWGRSQADEPEKIQIEFVSANPNGPMHVGHGRWAAVGDTIARLLDAAGHTVEREFYINDHGVQMRKFGASIAARYLQLFERDAEIPEGGYQGEYITELAKEILVEVGDRFVDAPEDERIAFMRFEGERRMLLHQRETLTGFGVEFDMWFSERSLHDAGAVQRVIELLDDLGHIYDEEGARWLRTTDFGDDKDRVIVRRTGRPGYVAADIAYFLDKLNRGFGRLIYLVGADHHGWVRQLTAAIRALGEDPEHCEFLIGQFVHLVKDGELLPMSKRQGEGMQFHELVAEVGVDAARYTFLRTGIDQTFNFDIDLVRSQTQENPVYYVQYAHARICSIMRTASEQGIELAPIEDVALDELQHGSEQDLLRKIAELPEAVIVAANLRAPHRMTRFAEELAALFHAFYRDCRVLGDDPGLTQARLHLCRAAQISLHNTLTLLGVGAPEVM
jgi:arginyl-tRNA synthetase